ncbi:uncharacterized protein LOC134819322 isoform X4 [Bolinopsis microptera]|uniref:uncharacterized protein LOC134819322 isoform X4 n=1 Tax=Bolinopsis microptera TaxID=2820187 RepID=UPI0030790C2F
MDPSEEIIDEYFEYLADRDVYRAPTVLSWLTDYIDTKNENAIYKLLQHSLASEAVAGLVDLLEFDDKRLTESVVHILGTIVEHPRCRQYVLEVPRNTATSGQTNPTLFTALVNMLMSDDKNVVMNAAGTIANIAESCDGRLWILQQAVFDDALPILGVLTVDPHQWAASNSALVLARLTLSQEGIVKILTHERCSYVLINLSTALCGHNPGSSMNAAFAVGRLLEREDARSKLLAMKNFKNTMTALTKMLYNKEAGPRKNACFAFSCLANSKEGHDRLLGNVNSELILDQLVRLITDPDDETAWFAAVTLRSVGSQKEGVFRLRDHKSVHSVLKKLVKGGGVTLKSDLLTEVKMTLDILGKLPKLPAPIMTTIDSFSVSARWESVIATVGNRVSYQFFQGCTCVYEGTKTNTTVKNLKPFTSYVFRIRAINATDEGPYSGPALITTNEGVPGPPGEVNNEGKPQHNAIKISWTPPLNPNGTLTGYNIYSDGKRVGVVGIDKLCYVVKDLPHSTSIPIQVAPVTAAGEGEKSIPIMCSTLNLSDYPPKKPILSTSGGANEINVSWIDPPKQLGPIDHYELVMNGEVIYSGKEQGYRVSNLEPLTNYTFNVRVVTADKYVIESEPAKKKAGSKDDEGISREEKEELLAERDAMQARLKAELARLKALEAALKEEEHLRRLEVDHKLTLGSRGGPAYNLDDPDVAGCLSGSLLAKLKAAGITDISMLEEKDILALGLNEEELNQLLDAIYMAKYLKASPRLAKFLKDTGYNPLELWKLNYQDVNKMALPEKLKKELFGHVLGQQTSFVANLEIPTSRNIILKGWKDENLAFTARHDAKLVTKNFHAKEELTDYIDKLRAVVQKNGGGASGTESEGELPEPEKHRTPTPEVAKFKEEWLAIMRDLDLPAQEKLIDLLNNKLSTVSDKIANPVKSSEAICSTVRRYRHKVVLDLKRLYNQSKSDPDNTSNRLGALTKELAAQNKIRTAHEHTIEEQKKLIDDLMALKKNPAMDRSDKIPWETLHCLL